jgi:beta-glucosidase
LTSGTSALLQPERIEEAIGRQACQAIGVRVSPQQHDSIVMNTPRVRFSLLVAALLAIPAVARAHSANEAAPRGDQGWKDRQELLNKRAAEAGDKAQVIFIGDSITQGWEGEGKEIWARYYAPRNAINLGIGGDRTQHVLWRLEHGNLAGLRPKAAVVMIGTNNSNGEDNTPEQIVDGVAAIVAKLRSALPQTKVLLLAIFPRNENFSAQRGKLAQINQVLRKLADEQNVFWIDLGHWFLNIDGTMPRELMPDYLHLSPKAYAIWAEALEARLASILGDTPVIPAPSGSANLTGEWIWTIRDMNGNPVEAPMILKQEGNSVTGKFARGPDRWLEIENGKVNGREFSWTVKRDRPDGATMTYEMSGRLEGNQITGQARTQMDGNDITVDWSAKRK